MDNSSDPCADSTPVSVFLLPDDNLLVGAGTDPLVAAKFPKAFCELLQSQIEEAFLSWFLPGPNLFLSHRQ